MQLQLHKESGIPLLRGKIIVNLLWDRLKFRIDCRFMRIANGPQNANFGLIMLGWREDKNYTLKAKITQHIYPNLRLMLSGWPCITWILPRRLNSALTWGNLLWRGTGLLGRPFLRFSLARVVFVVASLSCCANGRCNCSTHASVGS